MYLHCSVLVNSTTLMVIGGIQNDVVVSNTFYFNLDQKMWNVGPALNTARCQQSCGRIRKDSSSPELSLIVAGGSKNPGWLSSVEILDQASNAWRAGAQLPFGISASKMIENPNGGVILVGGTSDLNLFEDFLYQLPHGGAGAVWIRMEQKLKIRRFFHVAFLVQDTLVDCL
jgi:hypothetical protein